MTSPFGKTGEERTGCYISKTIKMILSMSLIAIFSMKIGGPCFWFEAMGAKNVGSDFV